MSDQWQVATGAAAGTKICVRDVPKISNLPFVRAPYTLRKAQKMLAPPPSQGVGGGGVTKFDLTGDSDAGNKHQVFWDIL